MAWKPKYHSPFPKPKTSTGDSPRVRKPDLRESSSRRGYDARWRELRRVFLSHYPLCKMCKEKGRLTPGKVVDHIKDHKGDPELLWDWDNLQTLCQACHNRKTAGTYRRGNRDNR